MVCRNCGNPLEDGVKFCTKCGQRVEMVAEANTEAAGQVQNAFTEATMEVRETMEGVSEKVKKFPKGLLIAVAAIAIVLVVVLVNFKSVSNTVNKMVSSEEKYYASVEKKEIKEMASNVADIYENSILEYSDYRDLSVDYGVEVELSEDAAEMLAAAIEADDSEPFTKMALDFFLSFKGDVISADASATLGKTELISVNGVADLEKGEAYGIIEDLTSKYIGISFEEYTEDISELMEQGDEFIKLLPKKKTVESILNRYLTIAAENIEGITEEKDTIKVNDIEQKCTAISVRITEKDVKNIAVAVLEEAKDDKELISLIADFAAAVAKMEGEEDADAKEYEEMIIEEIEAALESANEAEEDSDDEDSDDEDSDEAIVMNVWVNGKGEVIGRELIVNDETLFVYKMPEKGGKFAYKGVIGSNGEEIILEGEGKKSSSSLSGEFSLKMKTQEYDWDTDTTSEVTHKFIDITIDKMDTKKTKEGYLNGSFAFKFSEEFIEESGAGVAGVIIGNYSIKCDIKSGKDGGTVVLSLMDKEEMFAKLTVNTKIGSGKSASLPKGILVEDEEDIIEWAKTLKFDKFIKNLEKSGLPEEIVEQIEEACEELEDELSNY